MQRRQPRSRGQNDLVDLVASRDGPAVSEIMEMIRLVGVHSPTKKTRVMSPTVTQASWRLPVLSGSPCSPTPLEFDRTFEAWIGIGNLGQGV